jgi:hypothetical protein
MIEKGERRGSGHCNRTEREKRIEGEEEE